MHLQENTLFDLVKVTRNVAKYPLHHVTYSATKFEAAIMSNNSGVTRNMTDGQMHRWTDRLWYEIIIPFFSKEKSRYNYQPRIII